MKRLIVALVLAVSGFAMGYGAIAEAYPADGLWGRAKWRGFFTNTLDTAGEDVWPTSGGPTGCKASGGSAIPTSVRDVTTFINFVKCKYNNGSTQEKRGAAFIVYTMTRTTATSTTSVSSAVWSDWEDMVRAADAQGRISWYANYSFTFNSYYQGCCGGGSDPADDAFYEETATSRAIVFRNPNGSVRYAIKYECANPVGTNGFGPLQAVNFNMNGTTSVNRTEVDPGQQLTFSHTLTNGGPSATNPSTIDWTTQRATSAAGPWTNVSSGDAGAFTNGQTKTPGGSGETLTVPADIAPGTQYCRRITWNPDQATGGSGSSTPRCATVRYNFTLTPVVNTNITNSSGGSVVGNIAEPGDTVTFTYAVNNGGTTASQNVNCTYRQASHGGYSTAAPGTVFTPSGANCSTSTARSFPAQTNNTQTATETVTAIANTSICRTLEVNPATQTGGSVTSSTVCVHVATKPFMEVYGGDIAVGGGVESAPGACSVNSGASIIGWNRRDSSGGGWRGAGTQFAAYAMSTIYDFSSGHSSGSVTTAAVPSGLTFANTGADANNGNFGGMFGAASCMPNYYAALPSSANNLGASTSAALSTGSYLREGDLQINGGTIAPGNKVSVFVNGDVYISGNVTYGGSGGWNNGNIPMFRVVARGNIYVGNGVTQLDGLYVAQPTNSSTKGIIFTCALSMGSVPANTAIVPNCTNKLTVNGAFMARQVQLMRASGTLSSGTAAEDPAEIFNYNPLLWISQPAPTSGNSGAYDAINSLPPVL